MIRELLVAVLFTLATQAQAEKAGVTTYEAALLRGLPSDWKLLPKSPSVTAIAASPQSDSGSMVVSIRRLEDPPGTVELISETGRRELASAVEARGGVLDVTAVVASSLSGVPEISTQLRGSAANEFQVRYLLLPSRPALLVTIAGPTSVYTSTRRSIEKKLVSALLELQSKGKI